eukprot:gene18993-biopygen2467
MLSTCWCLLTFLGVLWSMLHEASLRTGSGGFLIYKSNGEGVCHRRRRDAAVRAGHMSRARGAAVGRAGRGGPVRASPAPVRAKSHWWRRSARAGEQPGERDLSRTIRLPVAVSACFCVQ